jgi:hypothetical protein
VEEVREWAAQCHGNDIGLPARYSHNARDGRIVWVGRTVPGYDSQAVSGGRCGGDSPLTSVLATYGSI